MSGEKKPTPPSAAGGGGSGGGCVAPCPAPKPGHKIILNGTPEEKKKLEAILDKIRETPSGRKLLTDIDNAKHPVEYQLGDAKADGGGKTTLKDGMGKASDGTGTKTTVTLDKDLKDDSIYVYDKDGNKIADPVDVIAAHELTHALEGANGTIDSADPEFNAITGENKIRNERKPKLPERDPHNHGGGYN
jgi:NleD-like pathogen effector protein (putative zinc metallopeptidase)